MTARLLLAALCLIPALGWADDIRPLYVEIEEVEQFQFTVRVKKPPRIAEANRPRIQLPGHCTPTRQSPIAANSPATTWQCRQDIAGEEISLAYPRYQPANSSVIKVKFTSGESHTRALASGETRWQLPRREEAVSIATQYTRLGMEHIWIGYDHLLFLLCLIWIARSWQRIVLTITGFTLAHSVTLALSALEVVRVAVPPVEASIALSVLFLATEIIRNRRDTLTWRHPIAISSSFGLLHGLGFAAVLKEIGLPQTEVVTGLLFFNVGVEIGQIGFALVVIAVIHITMKLAPAGQAISLRHGLGYAVGCTSALWFIERTSAFLP